MAKEWALPEEFVRVKEELQCQPWPSDVILQDLISSVGSKTTSDAFFIADLGEVVKLYRRWMDSLPGVHPYYAVKCNPSQGMIKTLESLGCNFDCASKGELELVLGLGISPQRIIYANPCKQVSGLQYAKEQRVSWMTFDNLGELDKVKNFFPEAQLVIRLAADDSYSRLPLGTKFGAHPTECVDLLKRALELNLKVIGVSFHVGSGCTNAMAFDVALTLARKVFDDARQLGIDFEVVDIGGGFSGFNTVIFQQCADVIRKKQAELFGNSNVRFIAEPGRYFAATAHTLALRVIAKRGLTRGDSQHYNYYLGDGVYGSLNSFLFAQSTKPQVYIANPSPRPPTSCTLFGPTCDALDVIYTDIRLPELTVGEWIYFLNYGAYTSACGGSFNGITPPTVHYFSAV